MTPASRILLGSGFGIAAIAAIGFAVLFFTPLPDSGDSEINTADAAAPVVDATNRTPPMPAPLMAPQPRPTEIASVEPNPSGAGSSVALSAGGTLSTGAPPPMPTEDVTASGDADAASEPSVLVAPVLDPAERLYRDGLALEAIEMWKERALSGDVEAAWRVGVEYADGKPNSVQRDWAEARKWMAMAAKGGDARAIFDLGSYYEYGLGVPADLSRAYRYYLESARRGHPQGQYNAGNMLETGDGTAVDEIEGLKWYLLAAEQGMVSVQLDETGRLDREAPDALTSLMQRMSPEDVGEAKRRAAEFVPLENTPLED
ncbi:MAG TPA: tetratricopeptide repeat protein [Micropepsaceae bacterium]|nr:tetratricopeptide repeat protein [Micropepsaceae bacterium]